MTNCSDDNPQRVVNDLASLLSSPTTPENRLLLEVLHRVLPDELWGRIIKNSAKFPTPDQFFGAQGNAYHIPGPNSETQLLLHRQLDTALHAVAHLRASTKNLNPHHPTIRKAQAFLSALDNGEVFPEMT